MNNKTIVWIFVFLFLATAVWAKPPFSVQTLEGDNGLTIQYPQFGVVPSGQHFELNVHVYNTSDGVFITNSTASCELHLYNISGDHILQENMPGASNGKEFALFISAGNFSVPGEYAYLIQCNTTDQAGFDSGLFIVTDKNFDTIYNSDTTSGLSTILFVMAITFLCFYLALREQDISNNPFVELIFRRAAIVIGIFTLMLNSAIIATISDYAGLPLSSEIFQYMFIFSWAGYIAIVVLMIKTLFDIINLYKEIQKKKRMGL